ERPGQPMNMVHNASSLTRWRDAGWRRLGWIAVLISVIPVAAMSAAAAAEPRDAVVDASTATAAESRRDISAGNGPDRSNASERESENQGHENTAITELSVAPLDQFDYPAGRPEWLAELPELDGEVHHWVVLSSPAETREQSVEELERLQQAALTRYIEGRTESQTADEILAIIDRGFEERWISDRYAGKVQQGDTVLYEDAAKLTFDQRLQDEIAYAWKRIQVRDRLAATGVLVAGGLGCLIIGCVVSGFLGRRIPQRVE
ncbi:MAG: hypothetical protein ACF788_00995, partial [Novipirellula sp. JB048]